MARITIPFAEVDFRGDHRRFGIKRNDRRYHFLAIGRTGSGKSNLLSRLIEGDLNQAEGLAVIDPHGDLAVTTIEAVPPWRRGELWCSDLATRAIR